jgi:enoyl reductase-like protein
MKLSALRIERMLEKIEARLVPPERKWLKAIIHGDDEAEAKEKALAEHVAHHPEDVGRTVEDFKWIMHVIVRPAA